MPYRYIVGSHDPKQDSDVYLSDVLERPELANKEQRKLVAVEAYVAAANVAKMWVLCGRSVEQAV